jgi:replicative DNA helicase
MFLDFKENIELLEKIILKFVLTEDDNDIIVRPKNADVLEKKEMLPLLRSYFFSDDNHQQIYKVAKEFFKEHNRLPTKKEIKEMLALTHSFVSDSDVDDVLNTDLSEYSFGFLYKYTKAFILYKNLNSTFTSMVSELKTQDITPENIEGVVDKLRNDVSSKLAVSFSSAGTGLDFFEAESHIQPKKSGTPTGFEFIDKALDGGWNPKTLVVFQGRPKVGKSMVLSNVAGRAVLRGVNVGIATLELSQEAYVKRVGANILNVPYKEYNDVVSVDDLRVIRAKLVRLQQSNPNLGKLQIAEFPTGAASAFDIENYFLKQEQIKGCKFKVIVVDYLNLMKPINPKEGMYEKIKVISEELRAIAIRNEWTIVTATQIKREAVTDSDIGMEDVAESFGLIHTVDTLFGLIRAPLEKAMKIKVIANRDGGYTESYQRYDLVYDYARMTELTGPADTYYSDEDQAADLKQEMLSQYTQVNSNSDSDFGIEFQAVKQEQPHVVEEVSNKIDEAPFDVDEAPKALPTSTETTTTGIFDDLPSVESKDIKHDSDWDDLLNSI